MNLMCLSRARACARALSLFISYIVFNIYIPSKTLHESNVPLILVPVNRAALKQLLACVCVCVCIASQRSVSLGIHYKKHYGETFLFLFRMRALPI